MKKILGTLLSLSLSLLFAAPGSAAPVKAAGKSGVIPTAPRGTPVQLYGQTSNAAGNGAPDQDFEAAFNAYDSEAADDFIVTDAAGWTVEQVRTVGTTGASGGSTVKVTFLTNSTGGGDPDLPGTAVAGCTYTGISPTDTAGSFVINLPTSCVLAQGTYWVAIQTTQNFGSFGQHFWSNRTVQSNSESAWRNPGNGFATGCTSYAPQTVCGVGGGTNPDFLFEIWGTVGGVGGDVSISKTGLASPGTVVYTISVSNAGPANATNVVVTDLLPAGVAYVSDTCPAQSNLNTPPPWTWTIGTLNSGASVSCDITTTVVTPGVIVNTANVAADNDSTANNNTSTTTVTGAPAASPPGIPTLDTVGLVVLLALLAACALVLMRRRARA